MDEMDTSGFYKYENGELMYAPNFVCAHDFEIFREQREQYNYPVHGWYWFASRLDAEHFITTQSIT
jgi:hypothetical protein